MRIYNIRKATFEGLQFYNTVTTDVGGDRADIGPLYGLIGGAVLYSAIRMAGILVLYLLIWLDILCLLGTVLAQNTCVVSVDFVNNLSLLPT